MYGEGKMACSARTLCCIAGLFVLAQVRETVAQAPTPMFDGTYSGPMTLIANNAKSRTGCDGDHSNMMMTIRSGTFLFNYDPPRNTVITGTVAADGSLNGFGKSYFGGAKLSGRIQGNAVIGQAGSGYCTF